MQKPTPTPEQVAKLPAWAKELLKHLQQERDLAVRTLNEFCDSQKESNIYVEECPCTGEATGPSFKRCYIQSDTVNFVLPRAEHAVRVRVKEEEQILEICCPRGYPYIEPTSGNSFNIVPREVDLMRPHAIDVLKAIQNVDKYDRTNFVSKYGFSQEDIPDVIKKVVRHV